MALPIDRRPHSIRRTSHIDMLLRDDELTLDGAARDLVTATAGSSVVASAIVHADIDAERRLASLSSEPDPGGVELLIGRPVASGFRAAVRDANPNEIASGTPLALLLDDLPVATLISGYARLYGGEIELDASRSDLSTDVCSGWRSEGTMMTAVRTGIGVPVTIGPPAPTIESERDVDPAGWHQIPGLAENSMRRRRLVDVIDEGTTWSVVAMFRDTHVQPGGHETVLHEYTLTATIDAERQVYVACAAVPRVLPYVECPVAAASADRLVGVHIAQARELVGRELRGTSTCTHLNDLLRSLGDVGHLMNSLERASR